MTNMKVSLDGGATFQEAPDGVRVVYENLDLPGEDDTGELHMTLTEEGIISDLWASREESLDYNIATSSETTLEISLRLIENDA